MEMEMEGTMATMAIVAINTWIISQNNIWNIFFQGFVIDVQLSYVWSVT